MDYYNVKVVNDIIYNDTTNLVSCFKDYLIYDDISEFLKRFYNNEESISRLIKIYTFYDKYSKVFPNYIVLEENRYMFKNIERKQIAIDERQKFFQELEEKDKKKEKTKKNSTNLSNLLNDESNHMFNSKFLYSVAHMKTNSQITESFPFEVVSRMLDSHIQNGSILRDQAHVSEMIRFEDTDTKKKPMNYQIIPKRRLEDYNLPELVEKFLLKDSSLDSSFHPPSAEKNIQLFGSEKQPSYEPIVNK